MRLIDADALSEKLCETTIFIKDGEVFQRMINDAPTVSAVQGWIPVSERLPNTNGIYIVTRRISDGFECRNLTDACYFDGTSTWHDDTRVNHERKYLADVLAWMPLPEPYREEAEE